jgi:hypothetical protein
METSLAQRRNAVSALSVAAVQLLHRLFDIPSAISATSCAAACAAIWTSASVCDTESLNYSNDVRRRLVHAGGDYPRA